MLSSTAWPTRWCADGEHLEVVLVEQLAPLGAVAVLLEGLIDLEMIAPAGQFEAVVAEAAEFSRQFGQRQVGPLAREHRDRSCHVETPSDVGQVGNLSTDIVTNPPPAATGGPAWRQVRGADLRRFALIVKIGDNTKKQLDFAAEDRPMIGFAPDRRRDACAVVLRLFC